MTSINYDGMQPNLHFVRFSNQDGRPLTKTYVYDPAEKQLTSASAAQMVQGSAVNSTVPGIEGFAKYLTLARGRTHHAVAYGLLPDEGVMSIAARDLIVAGRAVAGAVARTNDTLQYRAGVPGIISCDIDTKERRDWPHWDDRICDVMPELRNVKRAWSPSTSSGLQYRGDLVSTKAGWRLHIPVDDASRISAIGLELFARLIDAGYGRIEISKSGQRLLRTDIDAAMYQPSRLDFLHGGVLGDGLEWRYETHVTKGAELLKTGDVQCRDCEAWLETSPIVAKLRKDALPEARRIATAWRAERVEEAVKRGVSREKAERIYAKAAPDPDDSVGDGFIGELEGDFLIGRKDGTTYTIDDVLSDPDRFHGMAFLDPHEPDYPSGECAMLFIKDQYAFPVLFSMAHGGMSYRLSMSDERRALMVIDDTMNRVQSSNALHTCFVDPPAEDKARLNTLSADLSSRGASLLRKIDKKTLNRFIWEVLETSKAKGTPWSDDDIEFLLMRTKVFHGKSDLITNAVWEVSLAFAQREFQRAENRAIGEHIGGEIRTAPEPLSLDDAEAHLVFIISGKRVADRRDRSLFKLEERNAQFAASVTVTKDAKGEERATPTLQEWTYSRHRKTVAAVTWRPDAPEFTHAPDGVVSGGRTDAFNTWKGLPVYEVPDDWEDHAAIWDEHIDYLIPDRTMLKRYNCWLAHMIQKPGELPATAYCMIAETHGIGRNWMASVLTRVLRGYVRPSLSLEQLFEKSFNGTISQKLLAVVDEVHERQTRNRYAVANRLRQMITAEFNEINVKYGGNWVEHNCIRWLFFSNYPDALPVGDQDRRIEFIQNPDKCQEPSYYARLFEALNDPLFIASVRHRLQTTDLMGFNAGQHAAKTAFRETVIEASQGSLERSIKEYLTDWPGAYTTLTHLSDFLEQETGIEWDSQLVGNVARQCGLFTTKIRIRPGDYGKKESVMFAGARITETEMSALLPAIITKQFNVWRGEFTRIQNGSDTVTLREEESRAELILAEAAERASRMSAHIDVVLDDGGCAM